MMVMMFMIRRVQDVMGLLVIGPSKKKKHSCLYFIITVYPKMSTTSISYRMRHTLRGTYHMTLDYRARN